jgi:glycosyltransferase involved in cell wall biosynthesis
MDDGGAITVLMPVRAYSREYLEQAIGSILGQSCERWELLVIADRGGLANFSRANADLLTDGRISILANEGRKLAGKLNTGMRHANNAFVSVLFADDLWAESSVEVLLRSIREFPHADLFHSSRRFIDDGGRFVGGIYPSRDGVTSADFLDGAPVKHLLCWRVKKALSVGGIDESLNSIGADDFDFPWTMVEHGAQFVAVPECLYLARDHRAYFRLTTHVPRSTHIRELRRIMRKHGASREVIRRRVAHARESYLRQCLYANRLDRYVKRRWRGDPLESWREPFA